jgi:hypothetical protein
MQTWHTVFLFSAQGTREDEGVRVYVSRISKPAKLKRRVLRKRLNGGYSFRRSQKYTASEAPSTPEEIASPRLKGNEAESRPAKGLRILLTTV